MFGKATCYKCRHVFEKKSGKQIQNGEYGKVWFCQSDWPAYDRIDFIGRPERLVPVNADGKVFWECLVDPELLRAYAEKAQDSDRLARAMALDRERTYSAAPADEQQVTNRAPKKTTKRKAK